MVKPSLFPVLFPSLVFGLPMVGIDKQTQSDEPFFFVTIRTDKSNNLDSFLSETINESFSNNPEESSTLIFKNKMDKDSLYLQVYDSQKKHSCTQTSN